MVGGVTCLEMKDLVCFRDVIIPSIIILTKYSLLLLLFAILTAR